MAKVKKTTREISMNYSVDGDTISSVISTKLSGNFKNVKLINLEDGIKVSGAEIISHAQKNHSLDGYSFDNPRIDTHNINENSTYYIFGAPFQVVLNNKQHYNNCGIESTLNTLAMAGIVKMREDLKDQKSAEKNFLSDLLKLGLADDSGIIGVLDEEDGGTSPDDYKDILANFNIDSDAYYITKKNISGTQFEDLKLLAYQISQGHSAILGVCAEKLWKQDQDISADSIEINHAVTIVGVVYDIVNPTEETPEENIKGFYIHDSGGWMTRFITLEEFKEVTLYSYHGMLEDEYDKTYFLDNLRLFDTKTRKYIGKKPNGIFVTITKEPIKTNMFNLNATGNKFDNIIWGNNGANIIKGLGGDDTLYGGKGNDEIHGGKGDDVIIGNNISADNLGILNNKFNFGLTAETSEVALTGKNELFGDAGDDIIIGGSEFDLIYGGSGNDKIWTGDGRNAVYAGKGNDSIFGGEDADKLFGDAGNDIIYGFADDDLIHAGNGNDTVYGGRGNDRIELGKGNDTVYFEGKFHGADRITSQGGKTTFRFIDENEGDGVIGSDFNFELEESEEKKNQYDLSIAYTNDLADITDGVEFDSFYNSKTGKSKALDLVDSNGKIYKVKAVKSKTINATTGNNVIFSIREKGATILTGEGNDYIVTTQSSMTSLSYLTRVDKITYTGGKDVYKAEEGNTYYTVKGFGKETNLSIYDNIKPCIKYSFDEDILLGNEECYEIEAVSNDDTLNLDCDRSKFKFFFDVETKHIGDTVTAYTTKFGGLYVLDNDNLQAKMLDVAKNEDTTKSANITGSVYMDSFFGVKKEEDTEIIKGNNFYGNGRIESLYLNETKYENSETNIVNIAQSVASWLASDANTTGKTTAFEVFNSSTDEDVIAGLIGAYTQNQNA